MEGETGGGREGGGFGAFEGEAVDYWIGIWVGSAAGVGMVMFFVFGRGGGRIGGGVDGARVLDEEGDGFPNFG